MHERVAHHHESEQSNDGQDTPSDPDPSHQKEPNQYNGNRYSDCEVTGPQDADPSSCASGLFVRRDTGFVLDHVVVTHVFPVLLRAGFPAAAL
jgi:hypothetical protein